MNNNSKPKLIGLCEGLENLVYREWSSNQIKVTIARLKSDNGKPPSPRNWSMDYDEPRTSTGGCFARIFASRSGGRDYGIMGDYGPEASYGTLVQYQHGLRALQRIAKRQSELSQSRGPCVDSADEIGRWLEACDVTEVWLRPKNERSSWLSEGEWKTVNIGLFVAMVREHLPETIAKRQAETATANANDADGGAR